MDRERIDLCDTCKRPIIWRTHERTGKPAPIDAAPDPAGNIVLLDNRKYRVVSPAMPEPGEKHTNHYQTCIDAAAWRAK